MPSVSITALPTPAQLALLHLFQRLRAHRVQWAWTLAEMAQRLMCST